MTKSYHDEDYQEDNLAFEQWVMNTRSQNRPDFPLLTEFLHRVSDGNNDRFFTGLDILKMAFEAGQATNAEDANRWRTIMECDRIRVLGHTKDMNHIGIELWKSHPAKHPSADYPQDLCRQKLKEFTDG